MAIPTGESIKIDTLVLEPGVLFLHLAMASVAGGELLLLFTDRVSLCMYEVAPGTIDIFSIVRTTPKLNRLYAAKLFRVAGQAGVNLLFSCRNLRTATKSNHFRESLSTMRP